MRVEHIGDATLYLGDCLEILPTLGKVDAVVTDPPYGIGFIPDRHRSNRPNGGGHIWRNVKIVGDDSAFNPLPLLEIGASHILWGGHNYANSLPNSYGWLVWDKTPNGIREGFIYSHAELAWTDCIKRVQKFSLEWNAGARGGEPFFHPTQKPVALMQWCLGFLPDAETILDPFMGSGTTGVACANLGRKFIGIEIEEKYFDIACKRIETAYSQPRLFDDLEDDKSKPIEQELGFEEEL